MSSVSLSGVCLSRVGYGTTYRLFHPFNLTSVTPIILYFLWKWPYVGVVLCNLLLITFTAVPFGITWADKKQFFHGEQEIVIALVQLVGTISTVVGLYFKENTDFHFSKHREMYIKSINHC